MYHNIKISHNSDCWGEIEALKKMLKESPRFISADYTASEIVQIAVNELYDALVNEKKK